MDPGGLYLVIAPIAAAFAGFGSLASSLGRHHGADCRVDASRLGMMLFASLSATLLGLLPATLESLAVEATAAARAAAFCAAAAILAYQPGAIARSISSPPTPSRSCEPCVRSDSMP